MSLATKHLRCSKCQNVYNNDSNEFLSGAYCGLFEIKCSQCHCKWLVCPTHDLRWSRLRYCYAQEHVCNCHRDTNNSYNLNHINNKKRKHDDAIRDDTSFSNIDLDVESLDEGYNNSQTTNIAVTDQALNNFIACHRDVSLKTIIPK